MDDDEIEAVVLHCPNDAECDDEEEHFMWAKPWRFRYVTNNKILHICIYTVLAASTAASLTALAIVAALIVHPFSISASFYTSTCSPVENPGYKGEQRCSCGKECSSTFPCVVIKVKNSFTNSSFLAQDESELGEKVTLLYL